MHNSINALILSILLALIVATLLIRVKQLTTSIDYVGNKISKINSSLDYIEFVKTYINSVKIPKKLNEADYSVEFYDISSKIDINFVDSTLFKRTSFNKLLKKGVSYTDFEIHREEVGFTSNLSNYKSLFNPDIDIDLYFTTYSLPNINCMSDFILKNYLALYSKDKTEIESVVKWVQTSRENHNKIDIEALKNFTLISGLHLNEILTTIPNWNKKIASSQVLHLSSSISDYSKEFYIGSRTTFWLADIKNIESSISTKIIFKWSESEGIYKPISIKRELYELN